MNNRNFYFIFKNFEKIFKARKFSAKAHLNLKRKFMINGTQKDQTHRRTLRRTRGLSELEVTIIATILSVKLQSSVD